MKSKPDPIRDIEFLLVQLSTIEHMQDSEGIKRLRKRYKIDVYDPKIMGRNRQYDEEEQS